MRSVTAFALPTLVLALSAAGCHGKLCDLSAADRAPSSNAGQGSQNAGPGPTAVDATRTLSEADIVQLDHEQNRIYAMSKSGSLAVVDASQPSQLTLMGKTTLPGEPFEMYRRGDVLLAMSNYGTDASGKIYGPTAEGEAPRPISSGSAALVSAVDVSNPASARIITSLVVPGEVADSRVVGDVLYLATYENGQCYACGPTQLRTMVTSFDISKPSDPRKIDQLAFAPSSGTAYAATWKRSVIATDTRFYLGGADGADYQNAAADQGVIDVVDISDPAGHLVRGAHLTVPGPITSRWQLDEADGVLRVVSQRGIATSTNGTSAPEIDTFRIASTSSISHLGHTTMTLPRQEGLKTVRFDGPRAYAITFEQKDPLFTFDLSDAASPAQRGQVEVPGWIYHLEPHGDRLVGLGLDRTDTTGNLNVALFDVADLAAPKLLDRVTFGPTNAYGDAQITTTVIAEDQNRIQKAVRVFDDGLIAIPFSGLGGYGAANGSSCNGGGGIQLVDWTQSSLVKRALLPVSGNARRAIRRDSDSTKELIAVSDSNVTSFSIERHDAPSQTADVVIGTCVVRTTNVGGGGRGGGQLPNDRDYYDSSWNGETCE